ncbi:hypothetical protein D3C74_407550 [compost metagenome]
MNNGLNVIQVCIGMVFHDWLIQFIRFVLLQCSVILASRQTREQFLQLQLSDLMGERAALGGLTLTIR